ncbi:unnamed protein product [Fraxinus pennsylvanica]|uniref:Uncharacterized protein n=1 Tax=Fraxinus pennsylvanica TaxID=56036 RepID=A0AAD2ABR0_9LAMI|nr:unnamed protein product [Fraxinus pennsylvanica]
MDLWVVAAAAGAGYIAKNWQNFSAEKEGLTEPSSKISLSVQSESRNLLQQIRDKTCPLRRLARKRAQRDVISEENNDKDVNLLEMDRLNSGDSVAEIASSSSGNAFENIEGHEDHSGGVWLTKLSPVYIVGESYAENSGCDYAESCHFHRFSKNKLIRMCCPHSVRSLNPSEITCLDAQQCRIQDTLEENVCIPSAPMFRPLLVTDRRQIIRSLSSDLSVVEVEGGKEEAGREDGACLKENDALITSFSLKHFESAMIQREPEKRSDVSRPSGSSDRASSRTFHSHGPDQMLLFFVGMTIGIISATTASKNEVEKLNEQLKQTHNLVQDLHDELENRSHRIDDPSLLIREPVASCSEMEMNEMIQDDNLKANDKDTENSELRSKIEAELEAELERLEHNLKASNLERISIVADLDPDFEPYTEQGNLKLAMSGENHNYTSESGSDTTETTTDYLQPINYAVSPRELSLRLHELIESRLQARIKELEIALESSEKEAQTLGSQSIVSQRIFFHSDTESSSSPEVLHLYMNSTRDGHMGMNLSLGAYNEFS